MSVLENQWDSYDKNVIEIEGKVIRDILLSDSADWKCNHYIVSLLSSVVSYCFIYSNVLQYNIIHALIM